MRCFIGINFNEEAMRKMNVLAYSLAKNGIKGNFVRSNNVHLTLLFLGDLDDYDLEKVEQIMDTISFDSFSVRLTKLTKLRDIIVLEAEKTKELLALQKEISCKIKEECPNLIKANVNQEYYPHVTLARENNDEIFKDVDIVSDVDSIYLFSSEMYNGGVLYKKQYERKSNNGKK